MRRRDFLAAIGAGVIAAVAPFPTLGATPEAVPAATGWASGAVTLHAGDVFTIAGEYAKNPLTGVTTDCLQQFVVTATVTGDDDEVPCSPSIPLGPIVSRDRVQPLAEMVA